MDVPIDSHIPNFLNLDVDGSFYVINIVEEAVWVENTMGVNVEFEDESRWSVVSHASRSLGPAPASVQERDIEEDDDPSENMACNRALGESKEDERSTCIGKNGCMDFGRETQESLSVVEPSKKILLLEGPPSDFACLPNKEFLEDGTVGNLDVGLIFHNGPLIPHSANCLKPTSGLSEYVPDSNFNGSFSLEESHLSRKEPKYWSDSEVLYPGKASDPNTRRHLPKLTQPSSSQAERNKCRGKSKKKFQKRIEEKEMWKTFVEDMVSDSEIVGSGSRGRIKNNRCKNLEKLKEASCAWLVGKDLGVVAKESDDRVVESIANLIGFSRDLVESRSS